MDSMLLPPMSPLFEDTLFADDFDSEDDEPLEEPGEETNVTLNNSTSLGAFMHRFVCSTWEMTCLEDFQKEFIYKFMLNRTASPENIEELESSVPNIIYAFHFRYQSVKWPIQSTVYLENMAKILAYGCDLKFKKAKEKINELGTNSTLVVEVANDVLTSLFIYLEKSLEHILDAVLLMECMTEDYSEMAVIVLRRVLQDLPSAVECLIHARLACVTKLLTDLSGVHVSISLKRIPSCSNHVDPIRDYLELAKGTAKLFGLEEEKVFDKIITRPEAKNLIPKLVSNESRKARVSSRNALLRLERVPQLQFPDIPESIRRESESFFKESSLSKDFFYPDRRPYLDENLYRTEIPPIELLRVVTPEKQIIKKKKNKDHLKGPKFVWKSPLNSFLCKILGISEEETDDTKTEDSSAGNSISQTIPFKFIDILPSRKRRFQDDPSSSKEDVAEPPQPPPVKREEPPPTKIQKTPLESPSFEIACNDINVSSLNSFEEEHSFSDSLELTAMCNQGFDILGVEADDEFVPFLRDLITAAHSQLDDPLYCSFQN